MSEPTRILRIDAGGIFDAAGTALSPGSLLLELVGPFGTTSGRSGVPTARAGRILAMGTPAEVAAHPAGVQATVLDRRGSVVIPGLVNAHAHLDLTHIGPVPHDPIGGFSTFLARVRAERRTEGQGLAESVELGVDLSLSGGVVAIGDIAGAPLGRPTLEPYSTLLGSPLRGVSFLEFFAVGTMERSARQRLAETFGRWTREYGPLGKGLVRFGLQPHAPYSVMPGSYDFALGLAGPELPMSTHLAETAQEREFVQRGTGQHRRFLEGLDLWDASILREVGLGKTPIHHMKELLARRPFLCAHVNDASDEEIEILSQTGTRVVYCPRASEYFGAAKVFGPHRYRDMMSAGVCVCLGTDSILNLPAGTADAGGRISPLDEMRLLHRRDRVDAVMLLALGTTQGAEALEMDRRQFVFEEGGMPIGILALPCEGHPNPRTLTDALSVDGAPEWMVMVTG